jgi:hypothetical protein
MPDSTNSRLHKFFNDFSDLSERAIKHWPLPKDNDDDDSDEEIEIGYVFTCITTQTELNKNSQLVDTFFSLYETPKDQHIFSAGSQKTSQKVIRDQIPTKESLEKSINNSQQSSSQPKPAYTSLLIGHEPKIKKAIVGCVCHYFPASRTLLIESIIMDSMLLGARKPQKEESISKSKRKKGEFIEDQLEYEEKQQIVLKWLLTYRRREHDGVKAGLYDLIIKLEDTIEKIPQNNAILGVFHEALNPVLATRNKQNKVAKALLAFHNIEARFLRFAYRHPSFRPLEENNNDRKYFLLTFPQTLKKPDWLAIESGIIMAFIVDYGHYLYPSYVYYKRDLEACRTFISGKPTPIWGFRKGSLNDAISRNAKSIYENRLTKHATVLYLHNVPRLEQPRFSFKRASVCFEIIVDEDYFEPYGLDPYHDMTPPSPRRTRLGRIWDIFREEWRFNDSPDPIALYCPVAHSGETDLFAYKYQADPPYFTRYFGIRSNNVNVHFPSHFEFTSEGRVETFYRLPHDKDNKSTLALTDKQTAKDIPIPYYTYSLPMTACVSYTYFLNSRIRVWHLVLKPNDESVNGVTELDIIKLMRFFSGSQEHESEEERRNVMRQVKFSVEGKDFNNNLSDAFKQPVVSKSFNWHAYFPLPTFYSSKADKDDWEKKARKIVWISKVIMYGVFMGWWWLISGIMQCFGQLGPFIKNKWLNKGELIEDKTWATNPDNLIELLYKLTGVEYRTNPNRKMDRLVSEADKVVSLRNVRSGVVEVDTGDVTPTPDDLDKENELDQESENKLDANNFLGFYYNPDFPNLDIDKRNDIRKKVIELYEDLYNDDIKTSGKQKPFSVEEYADYVFKSYCGICLGIFDYDRMGFQEIDDTLVPLPDSKTESSFLVIHRGVLAMLGHDDDVMDTFWNTLGINAYLLIPSAVLAHNDIVSRDAEERLNYLLDNLRQGKSPLAIPELIHQRNTIDDLLNDDILGDVFQYKTEQELYREGMLRRGITERIKDGKSKLEQLDKLINTIQEERNARAQKFIQIFVTIFGLTSIYTPLRDYYVDEIGTVGKDVPKSNATVKWSDYDALETIKIFGKSFWKKEWLFPENALQAAHNQILLIIAVVLLYSLVSWLFSPGSNVIKFWQRSRRNQRKLPYTQTSSSKKRRGK